MSRPREPLHPCQHRDRDCDDLGCPCLCERCIEDRLAIYATMPGAGVTAQPAE